jgi:hypothetical protein
MSNNLWDQNNIPHSGWTLVEVEDLRGFGESEEETSYGVCEMCGQEKIRFAHHMTHPDVNRNFIVGCICAEKMSNDYVSPKLREQELRNRASNKSRWLTRKWRRSSNGNEYINVKNHFVLIYQQHDKRWKFMIKKNGQPQWDNHVYHEINEAKLASFDQLWRLIKGD